MLMNAPFFKAMCLAGTQLTTADDTRNAYVAPPAPDYEAINLAIAYSQVRLGIAGKDAYVLIREAQARDIRMRRYEAVRLSILKHLQRKAKADSFKRTIAERVERLEMEAQRARLMAKTPLNLTPIVTPPSASTPLLTQ